MKKINKYIKVGVIVCLATVLLLASLWGSRNVEAAPARMSGVQKAINNISERDSFTIVEIVPSKSEARFGFLVEGYEPEVPENILNGTSSKSARESAVRAWLKENAGDLILSYNSSIYEEHLHKPQEDAIEWLDYYLGQGHKEERTGSYQKASEYGLEKGYYQKTEKTDDNGATIESWEYVGKDMGDYIWVDDENGEKYTVECPRIYYRVNYSSNNWFAKKVLELEDANIEVKIMTPQDLEEMLRIGGTSWEAIDLLYFNASDSMKYENASNTVRDFSLNAIVDIYNQATLAKLPVFLDTKVFDSSQDSNILKLAYLLKAYDGTIELKSTDDIEAAVIKAKEKVEKITQTEGVCGNVYFGPSFVNDNLVDNITGFYNEADVIAEFANESFYHEANGSEKAMVEKESDDKYNISRASLMKYIIHMGRERVETVKDSIRVLDIEPTRYSLLNEETIYGWLEIEEEQQDALNIEIVQTTTAAFNGDMTDLVEEYDLIYIGSYVGPSMSNGTLLAGAMNTDNGRTVYNNSNLDGLIYSDIGDTVTVNFESTSDSEGETNALTTRFSGNDITDTKRKALSEFVNCGYPVVIADDLYAGNVKQIDVKKVSEPSNMYQFMKEFTINQTASNVMKQGDIQSALLNRYVNLAKLTLVVSQKPDEYKEQGTESDDSSSDEDEKDSASALEYVFEFTDDSRVLDEDMYYKLQLYVDNDADGQYSSFEEIQNLQVVDLEWNEVEVNQIKPGQKYILSIDAVYLPHGFVPWKLQVSLFNTEGEELAARSSEIGYSFIKTDKKAINVLQVTAEDNDSFMSSDKIKDYINVVSSKGLYDIQVTSYSVTEFLQAKDSAETFYDFIKTYDLLVLGFAEDYCETSLTLLKETIEDRSKKAFYAIEKYVESGKPVLVSHDTTSYKNLSDNYWGYALNQFVRKTAGMDRYSVIHTSDEGGSASSGKEGYSNVLLDEKLTGGYHSLSYSGIENMKANAISQVNKGMITSFPYDLNLDSTNGSTTVEEIVNNNEVMSLSGIQEVRVMNPATQPIVETHAPYYQLDLDCDKDGDGESDLVVWYTLAGAINATSESGTEGGSQSIDSEVALINGTAFSAMPNDVRNNYYIYSLGNVTYTAQGYSSDLTDYEAKLFVNTLIAAYNLGIKSPTVNILSDKEDTESVIYHVYRPFDEEAEIFCETDQDVYFHVKDSNVLGGSKKVTINIYERVTTSTGDDIKEIKQNGVPIYLKNLKDGSGNNLEMVLNQKEVSDYRIDDYVYEVKISKDKMNDVLVGNSSLEIYVGVKVEFLREAENEEREEVVFAATEETFAVLEIKKMSLFNLD